VPGRGGLPGRRRGQPGGVIGADLLPGEIGRTPSWCSRPISASPSTFHLLEPAQV